jgi:hypothetical protein
LLAQANELEQVFSKTHRSRCAQSRCHAHHW